MLHLLDGVKPDLLVLPTHARTALDRLRVASAAEVLAREAACPALFVPFDARPFVDPDTGAVMLRRVTEFESFTVRDFLGAMRANYRRAWAMGLVSIVGTTVLVVNLGFYAQLGGFGPVLVPLFVVMTLIWFK